MEWLVLVLLVAIGDLRLRRLSRRIENIEESLKNLSSNEAGG